MVAKKSIKEKEDVLIVFARYRKEMMTMMNKIVDLFTKQVDDYSEKLKIIDSKYQHLTA